MTTDNLMLNKVYNFFLTYLVCSHIYSSRFLYNMSYIIKYAVSHDVMLSILRTHFNENRVLEVIVLLIACNSIEYSKVKPILNQRIEDSASSGVAFSKFISCLHKYGLNLPYHNFVNFDYLTILAKSISDNFLLQTPKTIVLIPNNEQFQSFNILFNNENVYSWNIFRADDLHLSQELTNMNIRFSKSLEDERSPPVGLVSPQEQMKSEDDKQEMVSSPRNLDMSPGELNFPTENLTIRPLTRNSSTFGAKFRDALRSNNQDPTSEPQSATKKQKYYQDLEEGIRMMDASDIDNIFDIQERIETHFAAKIPELFEADPLSPKSKQTTVDECKKQDDQNLYFYGMGTLLREHERRKPHEVAASSTQRMLQPQEFIFVMKCYDSKKSEDKEWTNLINVLGVKYACADDLVFNSFKMKERVAEGKDADRSEVRVGLDRTFYFLINNDTSELALRMQEIHSPEMKNKKFNSFQMLILYGREEDVRTFRTENSELLKKFEKLILLTLTYDVNVLRLHIVQVVKTSSTAPARTHQEKHLSRELVNVAVLDKRLKLLFLNEK